MAWWRARAGTVWSDYGGRGRQVALRSKGIGSPIGTATAGLSGTLGAATSVSIMWSLREYDGDVPWWAFALLGGMLLTCLVMAGWLVWTAPDLVRRRTVEGAVIVRMRSPVREDHGGAIVGYHYYVAVDDGRSDTATIYNFGPSHHSQLGQRLYQEIIEGDIVRLTVTPRLGRVVRFDALQDRAGAPLPPPGVPAPNPSRAPVTVPEVQEATKLRVRHVEPTTTTAGDAGKVTIETWTYQLVGDRDAQVRIYVAYGEGCFEAVLAQVGLRSGDARPEPWAGITARRFGPSDTLVVRGPTTVALEAVGWWDPPRHWDTTLARQALDHLAERHLR